MFLLTTLLSVSRCADLNVTAAYYSLSSDVQNVSAPIETQLAQILDFIDIKYQSINDNMLPETDPFLEYVYKTFTVAKNVYHYYIPGLYLKLRENNNQSTTFDRFNKFDEELFNCVFHAELQQPDSPELAIRFLYNFKRYIRKQLLIIRHKDDMMEDEMVGTNMRDENVKNISREVDQQTGEQYSRSRRNVHVFHKNNYGAYIKYFDFLISFYNISLPKTAFSEHEIRTFDRINITWVRQNFAENYKDDVINNQHSFNFPLFSTTTQTGLTRMIAFARKYLDIYQVHQRHFSQKRHWKIPVEL